MIFQKGRLNMQQINVYELKPHPRNNEFFDDMTGDKWKEFLESVKKRGVIEPVVITPDKMIVSGHQRVRACKELGISTVMCDIHAYDNDDEILQDLLETNIRQRGDVGGSAKKVGLRIKELERIYGIKNGGDRKSDSNNFSLISQTDLANKLGMTMQTLQNYKKLTEMIPELEELVDTGIATPTTALAIMRNLSEEEQLELISSLNTTKRITQKQVQQYIDRIKELESRAPKIVKPDDYDSTKKELQDYKFDYKQLKSQFDEKVKELQSLRKQIEVINDNSPQTQYEKKLKDSTLLFCTKVSNFIEQVGGYIWLTDKINEIPELEREGYIRSVHAIKSWADTMEYNINNKVKEIN